GGDLLAAEAPLELRLVELAGGEVAEDRVLDVDQLLSLRVEDGERAEREQVLLFHERGGQRLPAIVGQQVVAVDQARDVLAVAQRRLLEVRGVGLGDRERLVQRPLHLRLEPPLDRLVDEVGRDDEDQDRGCDRQRQEGQDELGLEARADDLLAAFEAELHEVPEQQHEQEQEDDQVQIEQREDDDVGGHRQLGRDDPHVEGRQPAEQQQDGRDDHEVALAP